MKEVGFKEYHDNLGVNKYLVLKWYVKHFSFTSLISFSCCDYHYPKQCFSKGHVEVYRASIDELLQFHQLK
jgi:hypothetical protein